MKKILIGLVGLLLVVLFIIPLFLPKTYRAERKLVIDVPQERVFEKVSDFRTWPQWSPWYLMEPSAKVTHTGAPGVVGSSTQWKGEKIGSGLQTLTKVVRPEYLETELKFTDPYTSEATSYWTFSEDNGKTTVVWGLKGDSDYPIGRYFGLFTDGMVGPDYEKGLASLKKILEEPNNP